VEENFFGEEIAVDNSIWKKVGAGDGQRASENKIVVQKN